MKINASSNSGALQVKDLVTGATLDGVKAIQIAPESDGKSWLWIGYSDYSVDFDLGQGAAPAPAPTPVPTPKPAGS